MIFWSISFRMHIKNFTVHVCNAMLDCDVEDLHITNQTKLQRVHVHVCTLTRVHASILI